MKYDGDDFIQLYGFTQDPNTLDYMIVMYHAKNGSLKKDLLNIIKKKWMVKLLKLKSIICGLNTMHQQKIIHCDFHHGNILSSYSSYVLSISDLGLCFISFYDVVSPLIHSVKVIIS